MVSAKDAKELTEYGLHLYEEVTREFRRYSDSEGIEDLPAIKFAVGRRLDVVHKVALDLSEAAYLTEDLRQVALAKAGHSRIWQVGRHCSASAHEVVSNHLLGLTVALQMCQAKLHMIIAGAWLREEHPPFEELLDLPEISSEVRAFLYIEFGVTTSQHETANSIDRVTHAELATVTGRALKTLQNDLKVGSIKARGGLLARGQFSYKVARPMLVETSLDYQALLPESHEEFVRILKRG